MKFNTSILFKALFILPAVSIASTPGQITEDDFLQDDILYSSSVTRLKQEVRNLPASVTIINRKMIEASSATQPVELMRLVPGFQVGCLHGNDCTVTYHGLSNEHNTRLHVMLNGRSVYEPMFGGTLWYSLPITIDDIESIEVIRGPNAASYGANSFSGVVNIKTFSAGSPGKDQVSYTYGHEREQHDIRFSKAGSFSGFDYASSFALETNSGFYNSYLNNNEPDPNDQPVPGDVLAVYNDGQQLASMNVHLKKDTVGGLTHKFEFGLKTGEMGEGYEDLAIYGMPERDNNILSFYENYQLIHAKSLLEFDKLQISHNYHRENNSGIDADGGTPPAGATILPSVIFGAGGAHLINMDHSFTSQRLDIEYEKNKILSPQLQTVWGAGLRYDHADADNFFFGKGTQDRASARLFGHLEWKTTDSLTINAGGLYEKYENLDDLFSPRLAANFHISKNHTIRSNVSRAYRVPSLYDSDGNYFIYEQNGSIHDWDTQGYTNLDPERIDSLELGYLGNFFDNRLTVDLRFAWETIDDVIDTRKTVGGKRNPALPRWRSLNYGQVDTESAEIDIFYKPVSSTFFKLSAGYANSWGERAYALESAQNPVPPIPFPGAVGDGVYLFVPKLTTSALVSHEFKNRLTLSAQYSFVESYTTGGNGDNLERLESIDLKLRKPFNFNGVPVEVSAIVKNIADNDYEDFANENLVGLESFVSLKVDL